MNNQLFADIGETLFGRNSVADLSRALHVNPRRIREWRSGSRDIPNSLEAEIQALLRTHITRAVRQLEQLDA